MPGRRHGVTPAVIAAAPHLKTERGDPGRIRTCDLKLRRLALYPTELRGLAAPGFTRTASPWKGRFTGSGEARSRIMD